MGGQRPRAQFRHVHAARTANSFGAKARADVVGLVLSGLGMLGLVFGIVRGNTAGWSSAQVVTTPLGGSVLLVAFVLWEARAQAPLLALRLFRDRSFTEANIVGLAFSIGRCPPWPGCWLRAWAPRHS